MRISENFTLEELIHSDTAAAKGIPNIPGPEEKAALQVLVTDLLQPLRDAYGFPMGVNSGYRSPELNKAVGGVPTSQHTRGEAADIRCMSPRTLLARLLSYKLVFDQAILYDDGRNNFLHLSYTAKRPNRMQVLYSKGTPPL